MITECRLKKLYGRVWADGADTELERTGNLCPKKNRINGRLLTCVLIEFYVEENIEVLSCCCWQRTHAVGKQFIA
jgi:hypothetical protein